MKQKLILVILLMVTMISRSQVVVMSENFDSEIAPGLPFGWSTTLNYDLGFRTDSSNFSDYVGASGLKNAMIRNSDSTGTYTFYSPVFSTENLVDVTLQFASRVSNNYLTPGSTLPVLEYSANGGSDWSALSYIENEANSTWALANGGIPIPLPEDAFDNPYVELRWTVDIVNDPSGTYRIDDILVQGILNPTVTLTVRVNMSNETISPDGVFIAGNFNGWDNGSYPMSSIGGSIYQFVIETDPNSTLNYRFHNGPFSMAETVPSGCGVDDGVGGGLARSYTMSDADVVLDPICYGECADCVIIEPVFVNITFQVDMSQQSVSGNGVHLMASFQGYNPATTEMTFVADGVYEYTVLLEEGSEVSYKFVNGNQLSDSESVPEECGVDYRVFYVGDQDETASLVCFNECGLCAYYSITFQVDLSQETPSSNGIHIMGNFQGNDPALTEMFSAGNGVYQYTASFAPGTELLYRFVNGNSLDNAEILPTNCSEDDGNGVFFRSLNVGTSDLTISLVCFDQCAPCVPNLVEDYSNDSFNLYPNPTNGIVYLQSKGNGFVNVEVFDARGSLVIRKSNLGNGAAIDLEGLEAGIYIICIQSQGYQELKRLVME